MNRIAKLLFIGVLLSANFTFGQMYRDIKLFSEVINHVRANYVDEAESGKMIPNAINGLLNALDPHCSYLVEEDYNSFKAITSGKGYGVGIEIALTSEYPIIISVVEESDAEDEGIQPGDIIKKINGESTAKKTLPELKILAFGEEGSSVEFEIYRRITNETLTIELEREELEHKSINRFARVGRNSVYIKCTEFTSKTAEELYDALDKIDQESTDKLIIDLRNNPGGEMQNTVKAVEYFLAEKDTIAKTNGRKEGIKNTFVAEEEGFFKIPTIILVNRSSASASELFSGALQDNDRALLLGTNTFGKGLIQGVFLIDNGALLLTIGRYVTPSGRIIQREYKGKSFNEYYNEIYKTDSTNYKEREVVYSGNKRKVYTGGGIIPDIFLENSSTIPDSIGRNDLRIYYTNFATRLLADSSDMKERYKYFSDFSTRFEVTDSEFKRVNELLTETNACPKGLEYSEEVAIELKGSIAEILWGKEAAFLIRLKNDEQLVKAIMIKGEEIEKMLNPQIRSNNNENN